MDAILAVGEDISCNFGWGPLWLTDKQAYLMQYDVNTTEAPSLYSLWEAHNCYCSNQELLHRKHTAEVVVCVPHHFMAPQNRDCI